MIKSKFCGAKKYWAKNDFMFLKTQYCRERKIRRRIFFGVFHFAEIEVKNFYAYEISFLFQWKIMECEMWLEFNIIG